MFGDRDVEQIETIARIAYIPATAGFYTVRMYVDGSDGSDRVLKDPVIAWQISEGGHIVYPVTTDGINEHEPVLQPGGDVRDSKGGEYYDSLQDWVAMKIREKYGREEASSP